MLKSCPGPEVEDLRKTLYVRRLVVKPQKLETLAVLVSRARSVTFKYREVCIIT